MARDGLHTGRNPLRFAFVGHSFVTRFNRTLLKQTERRVIPELYLPHDLSLDDHIGYILSEGVSGLKINQLYTVIDRVSDKSKTKYKAPLDAIVVDCGSNDLTSRQCDIDTLVNNMITIANYARIGHDVKLVIFCPVLRRGKCREVSPQTFEKRMHAFNEKLKMAATNSPGMSFFMFRGFWQEAEGGQLPISSWSEDLIHPGYRYKNDPNHPGFKKYKRNIRDCMQTAIAMLRRATSER